MFEIVGKVRKKYMDEEKERKERKYNPLLKNNVLCLPHKC